MRCRAISVPLRQIGTAGGETLIVQVAEGSAGTPLATRDSIQRRYQFNRRRDLDSFRIKRLVVPVDPGHVQDAVSENGDVDLHWRLLQPEDVDGVHTGCLKRSFHSQCCPCRLKHLSTITPPSLHHSDDRPVIAERMKVAHDPPSWHRSAQSCRRGASAPGDRDEFNRGRVGHIRCRVRTGDQGLQVTEGVCPSFYGRPVQSGGRSRSARVSVPAAVPASPEGRRGYGPASCSLSGRGRCR